MKEEKKLLKQSLIIHFFFQIYNSFSCCLQYNVCVYSPALSLVGLQPFDLLTTSLDSDFPLFHVPPYFQHTGCIQEGFNVDALLIE